MQNKKAKPDISVYGTESTYSTRYFDRPIPKDKMPEKEMPANAAYQLIHDEMNLDGNPAQNLASFVTTWMEPEANKLIAESFNKNFIDYDEYPQTEVIHERVVSMLADLFHAPKSKKTVGTSTIGSSEAIMLALLSHKFRWRERMKKQGKSCDKPNIVYGQDVHVCFEKFSRYFDVEERIIPMEPGKYTINADDVKKRIDENTICVGAILGTTFTGQMDDIKGINNLLIKVKKEKGWDIPIHVDGASGGFIAPFIYPNLEWDFRLERVKSINASGHKYGLVYPGVGWLIFRSEEDLAKDIIFYVNYLGGVMPTYTLNFSRNAANVIAQYYNLVKLGKEGYTRIMKNIMSNAKYLTKKLAETGKVELLNPEVLFPNIAVTLKKGLPFTANEMSCKLRERGWIIPSYTLPPNAQKIEVMRVVVKENFGRAMADMLYEDIIKAAEFLKNKNAKNSTKGGKHRIC